MKITEALQKYKIGLSGIYDNDEIRSIFNLLVQDGLGLTSSLQVYDPSFTLDEQQQSFLYASLGDLAEGKPVQYIIGYTWFYDLKLKVSPAVLIPRQETEELVRWVISDLKNKPSGKKFLDIATGSGCIAISLKKNIEKAEVAALDISDEALAVAAENAQTNLAEIKFMKEDILDSKLTGLDMDVIISNPPYVTRNEMSLMRKNVIDFEPHLALFVENNDPLLFYNAIAEFSTVNLKDGGLLYFEINENFGKEVKELLEKKNFKSVILRQDLSGKDRMVKAEFHKQ